MSSLDQSDFQHLTGRSIIPLVTPSLAERPAFRAAFSTDFQQRFKSESVHAAETEDLPDLDNVQGDVIYLFPKVRTCFLFLLTFAYIARWYRKPKISYFSA